jgi:hypothetical protein
MNVAAARWRGDQYAVARRYAPSSMCPKPRTMGVPSSALSKGPWGEAMDHHSGAWFERFVGFVTTAYDWFNAQDAAIQALVIPAAGTSLGFADFSCPRPQQGANPKSGTAQPTLNQCRQSAHQEDVKRVQDGP